MAAKYAGHFITQRGEAPPTDCGGENISPPLAWNGAPAGVKSFALIVFDPDGNKGAGAVHWIAHGIAPDRNSVPEGFGSKPSPDFVGGKNVAGATTYDGPCPTAGHVNHYIFSVFALDLDRTALPPGLTRDQFFAAVQGHMLDVQSMIGRSPSAAIMITQKNRRPAEPPNPGGRASPPRGIPHEDAISCPGLPLGRRTPRPSRRVGRHRWS